MGWRHKALAGVLAAMLCAGAAHAAPVDPANATPVQREQAQARFLRGKLYYDAKKYGEAVTELRASLDIVASPTTRLALARALRELGRIVEAYVELGRTAVEGKELAGSDPRYARAGESATAERDELARQLGFVTVTVKNPSDGTKLTIGGEEIRRAAWGDPAPIAPGSSEVVVSTPGRAPVTKPITVAKGSRQALTVDAAEGVSNANTQPAEPPRHADDAPPRTTGQRLKPWAWVAAVVGVAGWATFAASGIMANSTYSRLKSECGGPCPPSRESDIQTGRNQQTIANVGLAVGLVGTAVATTLFVVSATDKPKSQAALMVGPTSVAFGGAF